MTETKRKGLGGFDKVLIGCGIGCAALILICILGIAFGTMWFFTPGEQIITDVIANDASLGVIRLHELADDPGTQELLGRVLDRIGEAGREQQREQLPPSLRWISDMQAQQSNTAGLNMMIPKEMTIAFEQAEDGSSVDTVVAANPRSMVRMFKTMIGLISRGDTTDGMHSDYRGYAAYTLEDEAHLAFVDSTVVFATSRRALQRAIDRVYDGNRVVDNRVDTNEADTPILSSFDAAAAIPLGDWDIEGVIHNEAGLVDGLLAALAESPDEAAGDADTGDSEVEGLQLGFGFDVVSAAEVTGHTILVCGDRHAADRWRSMLEQRYQELRNEASESGLELEIETRTEGDRVVSELRLLGLEDLIAGALTASELTAADTE